MLKNISLHPKLAAVLDAVLNAVMLWLLLHINSWLLLFVWVAVKIGFWGILVKLVYHPPEVSRLRHFFSLVVFCLGILSFLLFIEWPYVWYLLGVTFIFFPFVGFWLLPAVEDKLFLMSKHHRRWLFLMSVFGVGGIWNGVTAIAAFKIFEVSVWIWVIPGALLSTAVAIWWWLEYGLKKTRQFWVWAGALTLIMLEMGWVILLGPAGNFIQGLILTWIWYLVWLVGRFYLSVEGIDWKRQRVFLGGNLLLIILFLVFITKWK